MTRLRIAVASTLLLPLTLAGCGDDDPQPRIPPSSASSPSTTTPSASPDAAVEPTLPPEAEGNDEAAAEAFAGYYWEVVNYSQLTGDVTRLKSISLVSCKYCTDGADYLRDMYKNGGRQDGGGYTVAAVNAFLADESPGLRIFELTVTTTSLPYSLQESSSATPEQFGPGKQERTMRLTWDKSGFSVASQELL